MTSVTTAHAAEEVRPGSPAGSRRLTVGICLLSNLFAGLVSTLMATYLPDAVGDLAGSADGATVGRVGSWVGSLFLAGWALGGVGFGWAADRLGRARTFSASLLLFSLASVAAALSGSWQALVAYRLAAGVGIGGVMVVSAILVAEALEARPRAVALGFLSVAFPVGIVASGAVGVAVADWRSGFLVGALPLALGLLSLGLVRDSARWLRERPRAGGPEALLSPEHRGRLLRGATIFGAMLVGLWATFSWLPAWAQDLAGPGSQRPGGVLMMLVAGGGIAGGSLSGFLANAVGRRRTLLVAFAGAFATSALLFGTHGAFSPRVYAEAALLGLFFGISQGALTVYVPELFPTAIRATATGVCFNLGRVATAVAVFFVGVLIPVLGGYGSAILAFSLVYPVGFLATLRGEETDAPASAAGR